MPSAPARHAGAMTTTRTPGWLMVTHEIRRAHDESVISAHCCSACALGAFEELSLAKMMGDNPPGPLKPVEAHLVDLATGQVTAVTTGLVPLDGNAPPEVLSWL